MNSANALTCASRSGTLPARSAEEFEQALYEDLKKKDEHRIQKAAASRRGVMKKPASAASSEYHKAVSAAYRREYLAKVAQGLTEDKAKEAARKAYQAEKEKW